MRPIRYRCVSKVTYDFFTFSATTWRLKQFSAHKCNQFGVAAAAAGAEAECFPGKALNIGRALAVICVLLGRDSRQLIDRRVLFWRGCL